jgi:hypothetical protein
MAASVTTGFYLDSVGTDDVGSGVPAFWPMVGWSVTVVDGTEIDEVQLTAFGPGGTWKDISLSAPEGQHLVAGATYSGGVGISGCGLPSGAGFTVHEIGMSGPLAATFWVKCGGSSTFIGDLRYNSTVPVHALLVDSLEVPFAATSTGNASEASFRITAGGTDALAVTSVSFGSATADFGIASETCTAALIQPASSCDIVVRFTPQAGGERWAELVVIDDTARGTHVVRLRGEGIAQQSGLAWGSTYRAGPAYTWTSGNALGRTVQSGTQRLHAAYATDRIGSRWARDTGPYAGIYYVRSTSGSTWSSPRRLNPSTQHAARLGLAAAGTRVYVTWVSQRKIIRYSPTAPRVLYVRVNTGHGAATKWRSAVRLTSSTGRVDYPTIAASGSDAYIAFTDSGTGAIRTALTRDRGTTWRRVSLGSTSLTMKDGKAGFPSVAASGASVAVAWVADQAGRVLMRVSADRGSTWGPLEEVTASSSGDLNVAVRGGRIAVAWTTDTETVLRQRTLGTWGVPVAVATLEPGGDAAPYAPVVTLQDPDRIAVAWAEELAGSSDRADLRWMESADGGATWFAPQAIASASASSARRVNDWASVLWPAPSQRLVLWNGWTESSLNYRQYLRKGGGTPVGPTSAAVRWQAGPGTVSPGVTVIRPGMPQLPGGAPSR